MPTHEDQPVLKESRGSIEAVVVEYFFIEFLPIFLRHAVQNSEAHAN